MKRLWNHVWRLWGPRWWWAPLPFVLYTIGLLVVRHEAKADLFAVDAIVFFLAFHSEKTKRLFLGLLPVGYVALVYDAMRFVKNIGLTAANVHICDLRDFDARHFGYTVDGHPAPIHDWIRQHTSTALDVFFSIPYGTFIFAAIAFIVFAYVRDYPAMRRFAWAFLAMNVAGFVTYHLYPAAPPWYFHERGCVADLTAHASEGPSLAHVDQVLGIGYFHGFYGKSNDVFGAVPSLHVAYPLLIAIEGFRSFPKWLRALSIFYFVQMVGAAIYLDHHWVTDVLLGITYAIVVATVFRRIFPTEARTKSSPSLAAEGSLVTP